MAALHEQICARDNPLLWHLDGYLEIVDGVHTHSGMYVCMNADAGGGLSVKQRHSGAEQWRALPWGEDTPRCGLGCVRVPLWCLLSGFLGWVLRIGCRWVGHVLGVG